jgi:predicted nicotinamide N-methyase
MTVEWECKNIDHRAFIVANTSILSPPLVPEVKLHLAHEALPIWQKTEDELGEIGLPPPFWAFAWAGGQALARYILDHPEIVSGKSVLDLASGSGLVGIAAMKAGAASVLAADIDLFSVAAIALNRTINRHSREVGDLCLTVPNTDPRLRGDDEFMITSENLLKSEPPKIDVILVGDLFYEKSIAEACLAWLRLSDADIYIGDPGRSYLPKSELTKIAEYSVPVSRDLEDAEIKQTAVWKLI